MRQGTGIPILPTLLLVLLQTACFHATDPDQDGEKAVASGLADADLDRHLVQLKTQVPAKGFTIVVQRPFVVIGDEPAASVHLRAKKTVKWAVERLKTKFFEKDPDRIFDIWLFKDDESYRKHTREIFGHEPDTPFGYSSPEQGALIMNIGTSGGTLIHEIVHPFVAANFPGCPAWFNEGLGSLYEQCCEKDGEIRGLTNWRLAGLQAAISAGNLPSFRELTGTTTQEFYDEDPGTNYAQARYLCYYLQEKELLPLYYRAFRANREKDPTGFETLEKVLDLEDGDAFRETWEEYVLELSFP
jgi:hypothetical protein